MSFNSKINIIEENCNNIPSKQYIVNPSSLKVDNTNDKLLLRNIKVIKTEENINYNNVLSKNSNVKFSIDDNEEYLIMNISNNDKYNYNNEKFKTSIKNSIENNIPIFYISKNHKRKCSHSDSKTKKNKIKKIIFEDYLNIMSCREPSYTISSRIGNNHNNNITIRNSKNMSTRISNAEKNILNFKEPQYVQNIDSINNININPNLKLSKCNNKSFEKTSIQSDHEFNDSEEDTNRNNFYLKKKTTNRKFRLFDKDVVIKKIMSNFLKYIKLIIENYIENHDLHTQYDIDKKKFEEKFSNISKCKAFLIKYNIKDFLILKQKKTIKKDKKLLRNQIPDFVTFLEMKLSDIYILHFKNSNYMKNYILPKIRQNHDKSYYLHFIQYMNKIF